MTGRERYRLRRKRRARLEKLAQCQARNMGREEAMRLADHIQHVNWRPVFGLPTGSATLYRRAMFYAHALHTAAAQMPAHLYERRG